MTPTPSRISLGFFPTPLHELKNLSAHMGGPRIWIKRDDCTGLALGGNKVRKLEYILADALQKKADVLITVVAVTSNHARQTAAAAAVLGLECHLVLIGRPPEVKQGNYLLDDLLGAKTVCAPSRMVDDTVARLIEEYREQGKNPYYIPAGGHNIWGALAYKDGFQELVDQADFQIDAVFNAIGTGTTHAGLVLGKNSLQHPAEIIGISVGGSHTWCSEQILEVLHEGERMLGLTPTPATDLHIEEGYVGEGYTRPYPELRETIRLLARTEGILLDPVYTGKAMVGMLDLIRQGRFAREQNIVFWHTGGAPELFTNSQYLCSLI
ncbi:MAG: D-cysteine desulfhydrase family protein [Syntrophomonadaceae bacterium]|nr:D-cysteine desulfhydrase family protein [Syntrophomonadaceae bacterium]